MRMAQNDRPGGYTTSTSINPPTIPTRLRHLVGHLRHLPQAQAGLPPTSRSLSIFDVPHTSKFVSSQHVSYFVAICCNTIIPRQTACLKPQLLLRSTLSLSRASSPAVCCQWTDVDTPKRYPAIHFKYLQTWLSHVMSCWVTFAWTKRCQTQSNIVKRCQMLQTQNSWRLKSVFVFRFSDKLINSIQLHSTPLKHHDTNYSIDPVPPASKGGHDSPESPWKKTNSDVAMETVPGWSMNWCWQKSAETSRNYGFYMDFTMKHRGLLQIFPSDQKNDEPVER